MPNDESSNPGPKPSNIQRAFNRLAVENAVDRAALLAHGFRYELDDFVAYARRTWLATKQNLQTLERSYDEENFAVATTATACDFPHSGDGSPLHTGECGPAKTFEEG